VQLVAQKFTKDTFPCNCCDVTVEPSSKTKEDSGARSEEQPPSANDKPRAQAQFNTDRLIGWRFKGVFKCIVIVESLIRS